MGTRRACNKLIELPCSSVGPKPLKSTPLAMRSVQMRTQSFPARKALTFTDTVSTSRASSNWTHHRHAVGSAVLSL